MSIRKLREYLDDKKVKYVVISHSPAYTMSEIAAAAHICGKRVAKTVIVKLDGRLAMAVLPSCEQIDFEGLRELTGASAVELALESEFRDLFPGCEVGAMPPFGHLYGLEVFVAPELAQAEDIVFNAGSHTELMQLPFREFERLVRPRIPESSFGA